MADRRRDRQATGKRRVAGSPRPHRDLGRLRILRQGVVLSLLWVAVWLLDDQPVLLNTDHDTDRQCALYPECMTSR